ITDFEGNPVLECMCGNVIRGRYDPELPFFTEFGSFWTNSTTKLLESTSEEDRQARTRNRCNGEGYESVALIPLRFNGQTLGLLQFNDTQPNNFTSDLINQLEEMASNLALALSERQNIENLVESERRFQKLFNKLEDAVLLSPLSNSKYNLPDNIKHVNKAACKLSGYNKQKLTNMKLWDLEIPQKRSQDINTLMKKILAEGSAFFESQIETKNGAKIDIEVNASLFKYQGQKHILTVIRDCTNRKNMERELLKNKKRYQALYENAPLPYQSLDKQGYIVDINPKWLSNLGYEREEVIGEYFADFLHPQQVDKFQKKFSQFIKKGKINDVHYKLKHKNGHYIHVSFTGYISYNDKGEFQQTYCVFQDITRQKRIEETLHQTENRYRHLIHASTNHMFMLTPEGYYLLSNDQVEHFGYQRGSRIIGLNVIEIYDLEIGNIYKQKLNQVIESRQPVTFEYTFQINNEPCYHQDTLYPVIKDDEVWAIGGIGRDISKRKSKEIALQEREAELSTILKNVPVIIATISKDENDLELYQISKNLTSLTDSITTLERNIILNCLDCDADNNQCLLGNSNNNCEIKTLILDTFNKGKVHYLEEMELYLDDEKHWFLISTTPINVDDKRRVLLSMFDITERKRAELRLRKTMQHLNNVEENFRQQASQKLHDHVGQNLTALTFNLDHIYKQLPEEYRSGIEEKFQDSMDILNDTIESIRDIISEMRPAVLEDYGLFSAIKWYGEKFAERTDIRFKINGQKPSRRFSDDVEITIFRVIEELFNNIAKHSKANKIMVDFSENEHYIELLIEDDGIGFDIEEAKAKQNATGLGIVSMEDRINSIGGDFWLDSKPEQGTKVKIKLEHET
ncbi:MAG TPA: PAS domain S-box protein, partial [bacterium]|nr:PAS domain S-box protein [bacterium]